jgi:electron transport complex protein RnfD
VTLVALSPPVLGGLFFFGLPALRLLAIGVAVGVLVHLAARLGRQPLAITPVVPALFGVALLGPGVSPVWAAVIALVASVLEVARARFVPGARIELGLLAYSLVFLLTHGALVGYLAPRTGSAMPEPIRLWLQYYGGAQAPIDPVRLYVGNVPGPVFATSLLAVVVGAAWLWYARRLSLLVILTFALGTWASIRLMGWSTLYHLDSGPLWFVGALVLADRRLLPASSLGRPLLGLAAGMVVMSARVRGLAIESVPAAVAGLQLVVATVEGLGWLVPNRNRIWQAARAARASSLSPRRLSEKVRAS